SSIRRRHEAGLLDYWIVGFLHFAPRRPSAAANAAWFQVSLLPFPLLHYSITPSLQFLWCTTHLNFNFRGCSVCSRCCRFTLFSMAASASCRHCSFPARILPARQERLHGRRRVACCYFSEY